jgi:hypothetical protein
MARRRGDAEGVGTRTLRHKELTFGGGKMKRQVLIPFLAVLTGLVPTMNTFEARSQTSTAKSPSLLLVVGADWRTCGDWKDWSENFKLGYAIGHAEGISQVVSFLGDDPHSYAKIKDGFSSSYGVTFGNLNKAVDEFL